MAHCAKYGWHNATEFFVTRSGEISIARHNAASTPESPRRAARTEGRRDVALEPITLEEARARTVLLQHSLTEVIRTW